MADELIVSAAPADDKIEALVGLVLQAVDQRLGTVRDQLVQITNAMARNQAEMQGQIDECRQLCTSIATGAFGPNAGPAAEASQQIIRAASLLTEQVSQLEVRMRTYTDERLADLATAVGALAPAAAPPVAPAPAAKPAALAPLAAPAPAAPPAPVVDERELVLAAAPAATAAATVSRPEPAPLQPLRLGSLFGPDTDGPARIESAIARLDTDAAPAPLVHTPSSFSAPAAPAPAAPAPVAAAAPAPAAAAPSAGIDIDQLSAQLNARLAAAVDRALEALA